MEAAGTQRRSPSRRQGRIGHGARPSGGDDDDGAGQVDLLGAIGGDRLSTSVANLLLLADPDYCRDRAAGDPGSTVVRAVRGDDASPSGATRATSSRCCRSAVTRRQSRRSASLAARRGDPADGSLARPLERRRRPRRIGLAHRRSPPCHRNGIHGRTHDHDHLSAPTAAGARSTSSSPQPSRWLSALPSWPGMRWRPRDHSGLRVLPAGAGDPRWPVAAAGGPRRTDRAAPGRCLLRRLRCRGGLRRPRLDLWRRCTDLGESSRAPGRSSGSRSAVSALEPSLRDARGRHLRPGGDDSRRPDLLPWRRCGCLARVRIASVGVALSSPASAPGCSSAPWCGPGCARVRGRSRAASGLSLRHPTRRA